MFNVCNERCIYDEFVYKNKQEIENIDTSKHAVDDLGRRRNLFDFLCGRLLFVLNFFVFCNSHVLRHNFIEFYFFCVGLWKLHT